MIDTNRDDVAEVDSIFAADWGQATWAGPGDGQLVVSPVNARSALAALIAGAHASLWIEDEEMNDRQSEDVLIAAARRGVRVEIILPSSAAESGSSGADITYLSQGGVQVRLLVAPYMHAKLLVVDDVLAFTGSENFSATSLDENRELGIVLADSAALGSLGQTFNQDWVLATDAA